MKNYIPSSFFQNDINRLYIIVNSLFQDKVDKAGSPYINHCSFVAFNAYKLALMYSQNFEFADMCYIVGLCHDIMEDCDDDQVKALVDFIKDMWGDDINTSKLIIDSIKVLTKRDGEKYSEYFERVKIHPIARIVKCADALHNSNITRFSQRQIGEYSQSGELDALIKRCKKYHKRYEKLVSAIEQYYKE